ERDRQKQSMSERERLLHEEWQRERKRLQNELKDQEKRLADLQEARRKEESARRALEQKAEAQSAELTRRAQEKNETADASVRHLQERLSQLENDLERAHAAVREAEARQTETAPAPALRPAVDEAALGDLVFGIAHQIRNPLAIIRSATESLMESQGASTGKQ